MSEPAKGPVDLVTWNLTTGEPDTLDPPNAASYSGGQVVMNLCDTLVRYDADLKMSPGLANYEQVSPTKLVYTLRGDATFWDGSPVTPEDVVYSLTRAKDNSLFSVYYGSVSSIEATGPQEVTVSFSSPDVKFNAEMTNIAGAIVQKKFFEAAGDTVGTAGGGLMCSGPFELEAWKSGDSITMLRNADYWDKDRAPLAKKVKFTFLSDTTALTQALEAGEIDGAYEIPPSAIPALKKSDSGRLYFGESSQYWNLSLTRPESPASDPKVREALQRIIDREALAKAVFNGAGTANYTVVPPGTWPPGQEEAYQAAFDKIAATRAVDVEKAKAFIEDSDYAGEKLVLVYPAGDQTASQVAQLIQQQAKPIGLNIELKSMGALAYAQAGYDEAKRKNMDLMVGTSFNSIPDPLEPLQFSLEPDGAYNYTKFEDPRATELLTKAIATFDENERAKITLELQELYEAANISIPLVATDTVTFLNDRLAGAVTSFAYWMMPNMATVGSAE